MNKIAPFLIVLVLLARGAMYIYDNNKTKIDNLVSKPLPVSTNEPANNDGSTAVMDEASAKSISPFALTFILSDNDEIYYYTGVFNGSLNVVNYSTVGYFIEAYKNGISPDDLMFIIKAHKSSTYKNMIEMLDHLEKSNVAAGHFKEADITKEENDRIEVLKKEKKG